MSEPKVFAGIDIGATNIKFGLVSLEGEILHKERRPSLVEKGAEPLLHLVTNIAENLLYAGAEEGYKINYLGIGTPGAVDIRTGQVIGPCPNIPGWQGMQLGKILSERLNLPVKVDNDANAMALAESRFGAAAGGNSALCVTLGTGVGAGIIIDGHIWRGSDGSAGEIGYMFVDSTRSLNGEDGSLESFCNSRALVNRARHQLEVKMTPVFEQLLGGDLSNLTVKKLFMASRKGDEIARSAISETADYLGLGLAGAVNLLNPELVVIGGGIADGGLNFIDLVAARIKEHAFDSASKNLRVLRATLGNAAGFIGAGMLGEDF